MRVPRRLAGRGAPDLDTSAKIDAYVGVDREIIVDPVRGLIALHDGSTPGGKVFIDKARLEQLLGVKIDVDDFNELLARFNALKGDYDGFKDEVDGDFDAIDASFNNVNVVLGTKASAAALTSLTATVVKNGDDITAQATALTEVNVTLGTKASAAALTSLSTLVSQQGDTLTSQGQAITQVNSALGTKASSAALTALDTKVTQQGNDITSQGSAITSLTTTVAGKASSTALNALDTKVTQQGNTITSQGSAIIQLNTDLGGKASASALNSLTTRVSDTEGNISSLSTSINQVNTALGTKASASALSSLSSTVSDQNGTISAQANLINEVNAKVGDVTADGRINWDVIAGDGGYASVQMKVSYSLDGINRRNAGITVRVPADTNQQSTLVLNADRLEFSYGNGDTGSKIFYADGNGVYMSSAFIRTVSVDKIQFGDGTVLVSAIPQKSIHDIGFSGLIDNPVPTLSYQGVVNRDAYKNAEDAILVFADLRARATALVNGVATLIVELWENNSMVKETSMTFVDTENSQNVFLYHVKNIDSGVFNYKIVIKKTLAGENFTIGRRTVVNSVFKKA